MNNGNNFERVNLEWLVSKQEDLTDRYIKDEAFLLELSGMPFWKIFFVRKRIRKFLYDEVINKYNF